MDDNILKQFKTDPATKYLFAVITNISATKDLITVKTTSGLKTTIKDNAFNYNIGDQVILAMATKGVNNLFIIKKVNGLHPEAINFIINNDMD